MVGRWAGGSGLGGHGEFVRGGYRLVIRLDVGGRAGGRSDARRAAELAYRRIT